MPVTCPHCPTDLAPHRWGYESGVQRYRCRGCARTFRDSTGTPVARIQRHDRLHDYVLATEDGYGVRRTAQICGVAPSTVHRWRHRLTGADIARTASTPAAVISLFSGVGALDLGFETVGFEISLACEVHAPTAGAYVSARAAMGMDAPVHGMLVDTAESFLAHRRDFLATAMQDARHRCGIVGFVAGPPCPDFSSAGKQAGEIGDRGRLSQAYVDLICQMQPDFFLFENVKGLINTAKHRDFFERIGTQIREAGYATTFRLVNAIQYAVPQNRERVIVIGFRKHTFAAADAMAQSFDWERYARFPGREALDLPWPAAEAFDEGGPRKWPRKLSRRYKILTVDNWFRRNQVEKPPRYDSWVRTRVEVAALP